MKIKTISIQLMMLLFCFSLSTVSYAGLGANQQSTEHQLKEHTKPQKWSKKERKQLKKLIQKPSNITKEGKKRGGLVGAFIGGVLVVVAGIIMLVATVASSTIGVILGFILFLIGAFLLIRGLIRLVF